MPNAAELLEGWVLENTWTVGPLIPKSSKDTGGNFSQAYKATDPNGQVVFVKALDFERAFRSGANLTQILQQVTETFNYEVDMLNFCGSKGMDRVVRAISSGEVAINSSLTGRVPYLIFEAADRDVRKHLDISANPNEVAWKLRVLHHISTGLKQLHGADVVHQDVKPSNVLMFSDQHLGSISKLADLGRAARSGVYSPFETLDWAGDPAYMAPEAMYGYIENEWHSRRIGYDLYLLGSLCSFLFVRTTANASLISNLPLQFHPGNWHGDFQSVLPYLQDAYALSTQALSAQLPKTLANELIPIYVMLCDPDPARRGYPGQKRNKVALERFITRFDVMATRAVIGKYNSVRYSRAS